MNYYDQIKGLLISNEIYKRVKDYSKNRSDLDTYYNVGKLLVEAQGGETRAKYGNSLINNYSEKLKYEVGKQFNTTNLKRMRQFYLLIENGATLSHQLTWSHYSELIPLRNVEYINYYVELINMNNLSIRQLREKIKSNEYKRIPEETKKKLIQKREVNPIDLIKNPIIIKKQNDSEIITEKVLAQLILENIPHFLKELGNGFTFIENEYKIKIGDNYNYLDLLLYNIKNRCYVVVELKVTELKKEHIGQIQVYMNYIDKNIKTIEENNTIGIIICKHNNEYIIGYSSDERIISREYEII